MRCMWLLILLLLCPDLGLAATITHDSSTTSPNNSLNRTDTDSYTHTQGNLTNGIVLCGITAEESGAPPAISSVTYGGSNMTSIGTATSSNDTGHKEFLYYRLLGTSSSGSPAVVATFTTTINAHRVTCSSYSGVNQTTPWVPRTSPDNPASASDFDTTNPSEARVTVGSAANEVVWAVANFGGVTVSGSTSQTSRGSALLSGSYFHGANEASGASPSVNMSWTIAANAFNAIVGVSLNPASDRRRVPPIRLE